MGIVYAILLFCFIVFFHELGHFLLAKANKIDVEEFAIGMGPVIYSRVKGDTRYSLRLLPIGGFCAMGEDDEATDEPGNFNNRPVFSRISVIAAGAVFNFILAFVLSVILTLMAGYMDPTVGSVLEGSGAMEAGIQPGDVVLKIDEKPIRLFKEILYYNQFHQGETAEFTIKREGEIKKVTVTPSFSEKEGAYLYGVVAGDVSKANFGRALQYGAYEVKFWVDTTFKSLQMLVSGRIGMQDLSGPVGIVSMVDESYNETKSEGAGVVVSQFLYIGILLSANLGVFNLLPLPALDGGRLVFLIIEAISKRRVPPEKEGYVHMLGFALLMALMVFVMINDIKRIFVVGAVF